MAHSDGTHPWAINATGDPAEPAYDARVGRLLLRGLMTGGVSDRLGARAGAHPSGGASAPPVTLSGQTVTVHAHNYVVYPGFSSGDGPYLAYFAEHTHTLDPADSSSPRVDILVVRVYDDDLDALGERHAVTELISGDPNPSPSPPSVPDGALLVARITVPAGGSPAPSLVFVAPWTVAAGGVLPVRDEGELPGAGLYNGMVAWDEATERLMVFTGGSWRPLAEATGWEDIVKGEEFTGNPIEIPPGVYDEISIRLAGRLDGGAGTLVMRVNSDQTSNLHQSGWMTWRPDQNQPLESNSFDGTSWTIAKWNGIETCSAHLSIAETDVPSRLPFEGTSRQAGSLTVRRLSLFSGSLASDRQLSSLSFYPIGTDISIGRLRMWIKGHRS